MTRKTVSEQDREVLLRATPNIIHDSQAAWRDVAPTKTYRDAMLILRVYEDESVEHREAAILVLSERTDNLSEAHAGTLSYAYAYAKAAQEIELTDAQYEAVARRWKSIFECTEAAG